METERQRFTRATIRELLKIDSLLHLLKGTFDLRELQDISLVVGQINFELARQLGVSYRTTLRSGEMVSVENFENEVCELRRLLAVVREQRHEIELCSASANWKYTFEFFGSRIHNYDLSPLPEWNLPSAKAPAKQYQNTQTADGTVPLSDVMNLGPTAEQNDRYQAWCERNKQPPDEGEYTYIDDGYAQWQYDRRTNDFMGFEECMDIKLSIDKRWERVHKSQVGTYRRPY